MPRIPFLNTYIDNVTEKEALEKTEAIIRAGEPAYLVTPNIDHFVRLETDSRFRDIYKKASLILMDGMPLVFLSKLTPDPVKEKISGSDFYYSVCEMCEKRGFSVFLFGAGLGVAEEAAKKTLLRYPRLNIAGFYSPPFGFESDCEQLENALKKISEASPDVLVVALGSPKQEYFISNYFTHYNAILSLGLGATLDFVAGRVKRAPLWMQNCGLEWLYRLLKEPKRLAKRYLVDDVKIIPIILKYLRCPKEKKNV